MGFKLAGPLRFTLGLCLLASAPLGCGESEPPRATDRVELEAGAAPGPVAASGERLRLEGFHDPIGIDPGPPRTITLEARRAPKGIAAATLRMKPPPTQDLRSLEPAVFVEVIEQEMGPLESAHYIVQRGSEIVVDDRSEPAEGAFSLLDCRPIDASRPELGARFWIGGLRLEGAPDVFASQIEIRRVLPLFDSNVTMGAEWSDLWLRAGVLSGLRRTLAGEIDEATADRIVVWRRDLELDPALPSGAVPGVLGEGDACPDEMTLHVRVTDALESWVPRESEHGTQPYRTHVDEIGEVARATLYLRRVSFTPEIVDVSQRVLRVEARPIVARRMTTGEVRQLEAEIATDELRDP